MCLLEVFFLLFYLCVSAGASGPQHGCGGQRFTLGSLFSLDALWNPGLSPSAPTDWPLSPPSHLAGPLLDIINYIYELHYVSLQSIFLDCSSLCLGDINMAKYILWVKLPVQLGHSLSFSLNYPQI